MYNYSAVTKEKIFLFVSQISQRSHGIVNLEHSLHKKREEESTLEEQLQAAFEESETMQKKQQQDVDHMNAQLNDLITSNFEEEAAIRWVCLLHLLLQILHHIYIQLLLVFVIRELKGLIQLLNA